MSTAVISGNYNDTGFALGLRYINAGGNVVFIQDKNESYNTEIVESLSNRKNKVLFKRIELDNEEVASKAMEDIENRFASIDVLINNLGAAFSIDTIHLTPEQYDLMHSLNLRRTFLLSKICYSILKKAANPHIINISPPIGINKEWFKNHLGLSMSVYSMSMCTLGIAEEFKKSRIAVNSLWSEKMDRETMDTTQLAEAAFLLSQKKFKEGTGNFFMAEKLVEIQEKRINESNYVSKRI